MKHPARRKAAAILASTLLLVETGMFAFAAPAQAQVAVADPITHELLSVQNARDVARIGLVGAAMMGVINAVNFMAQKLAYDTAEQISQGNIGKAPLFDVKNWGSYLSDLGDGALGEIVATLNETGLAPFNLCDPGNPRLILALQLGLIADVAPPKPRCSFSAIVAAYKDFGQRVQTGEALKQIGVAFEPGQSGLGVAVSSYSIAAVSVGKAVNAGLQERLEGQGFKSVLDPITLDTQTPSQLVRDRAIEGIKKGEEAQGLSYQGMMDVAVSAPGAIAASAVNTFTTHLVARLLQKVLGGGLYYSLGDATCVLGITGCGGVGDANYGGALGASGATQQNADLITPPLQMDTTYNPLEEFSVCPDTGRTENNCVLDSQFAALFAQYQYRGNYMTVQDALDQGFLHGDWPLIGNGEASRARNADPYCFASAYCYSNLVKLRKHRILPIGWELAAAKSPADPVRLSEVVARFDDCPTVADPDPSHHPWCHLIDPNWVIKLPVTQCRMKVNGPTLLDPDSPTRAQYCADTPSCIAEDANGNCVSGYGYCSREENVWRLGGTECSAPYASCATFSGRDGSQLSLMQSTLDYGVCNASNVGCRGYATAIRNATDTASWAFVPGQDRVFVDKDAVACDGTDVGCTKVIGKTDLRRNLVLDPSFEDDLIPGTKTFPKSWFQNGQGTEYLDDAATARTGTRSIAPAYAGATNWYVGAFLPIEPDLTYTLSYYARQVDDATKTLVDLDFQLYDATEQKTVSLPAIATDCAASPLAGYRRLELAPTGSSWERVQCTFTAPPASATPAPAELFVRLVRPDQAKRILVDDVQLEEGAAATEFHATAYEGGAPQTMKVPPASLGCTGSATDPSSCGRYAPVCAADEVGCERYVPEDGGTPITAVVGGSDFCPAECVGYRTFKKEKAQYDLGAYPLYLIPSTAQSCPVSAVGCTEFTDLDASSATAEAKTYFSSIRDFEKPSASPTVYYTWEGSDTTGYQLKEWRLKAGTPLSADETGAPPAVVPPYDPASCTRQSYAAQQDPDCREFFDVNGAVSFRLYSKTIVSTEDCHPYRITEPPTVPDASLVGATKNQACQAQDGGKDHWVARGGATDPDNQGTCQVCEAIGGAWDAAKGDCVFQGYAAESTSCTAAENKCRLFTGSAGGNVQSLVSDDFERTDAFPGWAVDGKVVSTSTESTAVGGHSLRVTTAQARVRRIFSSSTPPALEQGAEYLLTFWAKGPSVAFDGIQLFATGQTGAFFAYDADDLRLSGTWKRYSLGPVTFPVTPAKDAYLEFSVPLPAGQSWYLDNVELTKVGSGVALIDGSWKTPTSCDTTNAGTFLPQAQLGCAAYGDRKDAVHALKSFDHLCRDAAVGCSAFIDTRNNDFQGYEYWNLMATQPTKAATPTPVKGSVFGDTLCTIGTNNLSCRFHDQAGSGPQSPYVNGTSATCQRQTKDAGPCSIDGVYVCQAGASGGCTGTPSDLVVVPPDRTVYLVDDDKWHCDAAAAGCTEVGQPTGSTCTLPGVCKPSGGSTTCGCEAPVETCTADPQNAFKVSCATAKQFVCNVAAGQTSCSYALPKSEPYGKTSFSTQDLMLDPANYDSEVCTGAAVGCEEWHSTDQNASSLAYFKSPDGRLCEYRENVVSNGVAYAGYFHQGTDVPCDPSFLSSGSYFGIRKNSDLAYAGYAGLCPADQAGCTEYVDPADVKATKDPASGAVTYSQQRYYYIKDQNIDASSCNGQVSQKAGCVLLDDTSDPATTYSAVGSYDDSQAKRYALTPAKPGFCGYILSCKAGTPSTPGQAVTGDLGPGWAIPWPYGGDILSWLSTPESWPFWGKENGRITKFASFDQTTFTQGCGLFSQDVSFAYLGKGCATKADCVGNGLDANVDCFTATNLPPVSIQGFGASPLAPANAVIKVTRDRICGEWYACRSSSPQWDPRQNQFREVCDEVGLCDELSAADRKSGTVDVTACKHWVDSQQSKQVLSETLYRNRDVSWTGEEYSGYSVPHMFPAHLLSQATIGHSCDVPPELAQSLCTGVCENDHAHACTTAHDCLLSGGGACVNACDVCGSAADCPLVPGTSGDRYACLARTSLGRDIGSCCKAGDQACAKTVKDGNACGGTCSNSPSTACTQDSDCQGGTCVASAGIGTCFQNRCYQSAFGSPNAAVADAPQPLTRAVTPGNSLLLSCRAYPEPTSPVPPDVVTDWETKDPAGAQTATRVRQGFQSANYCQDGEDCECSYRKVSYGPAVTRYLGLTDDPNASLNGVCNGGPFDGRYCDPTNAANLLLPRKENASNPSQGVYSCTDQPVDPSQGGVPAGTCQRVTRDDPVLGLQGYCLEQDQVTPIYGREDSTVTVPGRACLTWLPVDRLAGLPDIFNNYTDATYSIQDSYICLVPQQYKTIHPYGFSDGPASIGNVGSPTQGVQIGCMSANCSGTTSAIQSCVDAGLTTMDGRRVGNPWNDCPPATGFLIIDGDQNENGCTQDNDHSYVCIPWGAVHTDAQHDATYGATLGATCTPDEFLKKNGAAGIYPHGVCKTPKSGGSWSSLTQIVLGGTSFCDNPATMPTFDPTHWPGNPPGLQGEPLGLGDGTPTIVESSGDDAGTAANYYSDCWKIDAPVTKTVKDPYWGATQEAIGGSNVGINRTAGDGSFPANYFKSLNGGQDIPKGYYLGCSLLAQVSSGKGDPLTSDANKAYTENLGNSLAAAGPPNAKPIDGLTLDDGGAGTPYAWATDVPPYGNGQGIGVAPKQAVMPFVASRDAKVNGVFRPFSFVDAAGVICDAPVNGGPTFHGCYSFGADADTSGLAPDYAKLAGYLHQLFGKTYGFFSWDAVGAGGVKKGYAPQTIAALSALPQFTGLLRDLSIDGGLPVAAPQVIPVGSCDVDNHCYENWDGLASSQGFTVNGLSGGAIVGGGGAKRATFKFFGYAGIGMDPLRDVEVLYDVGDLSAGKVKTGEASEKSGAHFGLYKNHRGFELDQATGTRVSICGNAQSAANSFGTTAAACDDSAPFTFVHNYTCAAQGNHCEDGTNDCWAADYNGTGKGACVYRPAAYLLNNWGICAGTCPGGAGGTLCSNDGGTDGTIPNGSDKGIPSNQVNPANPPDECSLTDTGLIEAGNRPFIRFGGEVVVYPESP